MLDHITLDTPEEAKRFLNMLLESETDTDTKSELETKMNEALSKRYLRKNLNNLVYEIIEKKMIVDNVTSSAICWVVNSYCKSKYSNISFDEQDIEFALDDLVHERRIERTYAISEEK